jgi:hypothetical protein
MIRSSRFWKTEKSAMNNPEDQRWRKRKRRGMRNLGACGETVIERITAWENGQQGEGGSIYRSLGELAGIYTIT